MGVGGSEGSVSSQVKAQFQALCAEEERLGVLAVVPLPQVRLLPEQAGYLRGKLARLKLPVEEITAVSLGMAYRREEIEAIPAGWVAHKLPGSRWDEYVHAYQQLNQSLNRVSRRLAESFGGVAEGATLDGLVGQLTHVTQYFPQCVSHRSVAEAAGLGWRGKHGLIVTPEFGPALRLASLFLPGRLEAPRRRVPGCGECQACLELCPVLGRNAGQADLNRYREGCRRRIKALALDADVCGLCVRRCWERVVSSSQGPDAPL